VKVGMEDRLPCGCPTVRHAVVLGIDGSQVEAVTAADEEAGRLWVLRYVIEPDLVLKRRPNGTVLCKKHPRQTPAWADHARSM
jgi:hypothetical protein